MKYLLSLLLKPSAFGYIIENCADVKTLIRALNPSFDSQLGDKQLFRHTMSIIIKHLLQSTFTLFTINFDAHPLLQHVQSGSEAL